jgi:hypothetical protein
MTQDGKFYYLLSGRSGVMQDETYAQMASTGKGLAALGFAQGEIPCAVLGVDCCGHYTRIVPRIDGAGFRDMQPLHSGVCFGDIKLRAAQAAILSPDSGFNGRRVAIVNREYEEEFLRLAENMRLEPKLLSEKPLEELIRS